MDELKRLIYHHEYDSVYFQFKQLYIYDFCCPESFIKSIEFTNIDQVVLHISDCETAGYLV